MSSESVPLELSLSPEGNLYLIPAETIPSEFKQIDELFTQDSALGLLHLGLSDWEAPLSPTFLFWQAFSRQFITRVCKLTTTDSQKIDSVPMPTREELQMLLAQSPFMRGSEYLSEELLSILWSQLETVLQQELESFAGTVQDYLGQYNARWNLVGRVCFHLAENKNNEQRPFAFLATYTTQLSSSAAPQHLPLKRALQESTTDKTSLLSLLTPVQKAATLSPFIKTSLIRGPFLKRLPGASAKRINFYKTFP